MSSAVTEAFLAHSNDLMLMFDGDGTITWASPSALRLFGVAPADLVGRNGLEMIHPDDQERAFDAFARIPGLGDQVRLDLRIIDVEGRSRWVEEVATNLLDEPEVASVVGHLRDITDRRAAERAVRFQASLLGAVGQAITAQDLKGDAIYWNDAATALFGWSAEEALGQQMGDLFTPAPEHHQLAMAAYAAHRAGRPWTGEMLLSCRDARPLTVRTMQTPVHDEDGQHLGTIAVSTDLTESIEQRRRIEAAHQRLADAQASAHLGSFELDLRTGELVGSDELWRILGREPCGLRDLEHIHPDDLHQFRAALRDAADGRNDVAVTHRIVRPGGGIRWVVSRSSQFHSADATVLTGTVLDITERHEAEQALLHRATHDSLTGLANRRLFVEELDRTLSRNIDEAGWAAVLFVDLDDFKLVNDRVGHVDGDAVLRRLGERIAAALPPGGTAGRFGGDEFVVCFDGVTTHDEVQEVVEAVHRAIRAPITAGGTTINVDASIGVAIATQERRPEALLRNADVAMYAAKQAGGGRAEVFDDALHERARRRAELACEVRAAFETGQITTHFQAEVDLATGALFAFEALARWEHPERGMIPPDDFIPCAEEAGLIGRLGEQMLANACAALARWSALRPDLALSVGVNVSPLQLGDPDFPDEVRRVMEANGIGPGRLCLEVTESTLMDVDLAAEAIARLQAIGATIAIDDFGTGYSSFSRLKSFPVDFLKVDQSFVADIGLDADDVIITTMVGLAHSLGVAVIAEGIETEEQHRFLAGLGCQYGQGYLWSRPVPEAEATALVERGVAPGR